MPQGKAAWYALYVQQVQRGHVNWAMLAALAATLTALAATVTAVLVFWYVRQDTQRVLFSTGLDSLWHLDAQWNSDAMAGARGVAAAALLDGRPTRDVADVLDFFDHVALLLSRGVLDEEMVSYQFYWPMANYWFASQDYVQHVQRAAPAAWERLSSIIPRLIAIEARRKNRPSDEVVPTQAHIREFLTAESSQGECAAEPEAEARKVPL